MTHTHATAQRIDLVKAVKSSGLPFDDVQALASLGIHGACLLLERMQILRLDAAQFAKAEPDVFHELQKNCSMCKARDACICDLLQDRVDPTRQDWYEYCPNVATLRMFSVLELCRRSDCGG